VQATHIPLTQLTRRLIELPADGKIILVCRSGHRSALGAVVLQRKGAQVSNMTGGMNAWAAVGWLSSPTTAPLAASCDRRERDARGSGKDAATQLSAVSILDQIIVLP
jgi:hypothetical protein